MRWSAPNNGEIERMKTWRKEWFGFERTPAMDKIPMVPGMSGGHAGTMDMAADVKVLQAAPAPFDRAFIDAMIEHRESAIEAARAAETRAQNTEIRELAKTIAADQQREIEQMKRWRQEWCGQGYPG